MTTENTTPIKIQKPKTIYSALIVLSKTSDDGKVYAQTEQVFVVSRTMTSAHSKIVRTYGDDLLMINSIDALAVEKEKLTNELKDEAGIRSLI